MRFLVDNALSPSVSRRLNEAGHESLHVRDLGLQTASDEFLFDLAAKEGRVIVSADTDFGALLARHGVPKPSVVLFRHGAERDPELQARLLLVNLPQFSEDLREGALVVIEPSRIRVRSLPIP